MFTKAERVFFWISGLTILALLAWAYVLETTPDKTTAQCLSYCPIAREQGRKHIIMRDRSTNKTFECECD